MLKRIIMGVMALCMTFGMMSFMSCAETSAGNVKVSQKDANVSVLINTDDVPVGIMVMLHDLKEEGAFCVESEIPGMSEIANQYGIQEIVNIANILNQELQANNLEYTEIPIENVIVHIQPYLEVAITDVNEPAEDHLEIVTFNLSLKYDVIASAEADENNLLTKDDAEEGETSNAVEIMKGIPLAINEDSGFKISMPAVADGEYDDVLMTKHFKADGKAYYYAVDVEGNEKIYFTSTRGLGDFALILDGRNVTVKYVDLDEERTYDATKVLVESFPTAEKEGYIFKGWKIEDKEEIYEGIITDELLDMFHELEFEGDVPIYAYAVFEAKPAGANPGNHGSNDEHKSEETNEINEIEIVEILPEEVVNQTTMVSNPAKTADNAAIMFYMSLVFASIVCLIMFKVYRRTTEK